ncbi:hypothetical protein GHT09_001385 [Marmota monax]|uniref:Uncharacterized protein n=1 Tax=Marmota monax TaxID=9995 RepID=A0A834QYD4_MARMO|nr:hypothetical protein GHT09_001385 [Marmota monax]
MGTLSNSHASIKKLICENEVNIQRASWAKPNQHDSNQKLKLASDLLSFPSLQVTSCNGKLIKVNLKLRIRFLKGILNSEIHPHRAVCKGIIDTEYINGKIVCTFPKISKTPPCWGVGGGKKLSYK